MLSKLLRHEFRATGRIMLPVYALLLVSCGGCTLFGRLLGRYPESTVLSVVQTVFATLFGVTTFGMLLLTLVLMVYRFYKNLMTDEGYLMFTLPVSRSQLIWSKLLVALVWSVLSTVLAALAWMAEISVVGRENVFSRPRGCGACGSIFPATSPAAPRPWWCCAWCPAWCRS